MVRPLESAEEMKEIADRLLRKADAYGRLPTPVDDIIAAAKLTMSDDYVLDDSLISKAPAYLRRLLRSAKNKVQGLVDRRERVVHIAPAIENEGKRRFIGLHETIHHVTPHQRDLLYADDHETLSLSADRLFEREANFGAAELLFQREHFQRDARELEVSTQTIWHLADRYGSSFHAALRRYSETHSIPACAIVLGRTPLSTAPPTWKREEVMATSSWIERFGTPHWPTLMSVGKYPFLAAFDYPAFDAASLANLRGETETVRVDTCQTPYKSFVLLWVPRKLRLRRPIRVSAA